MTMMFARIPRAPAAVIGEMGDAADRLYRTFLTSVIRRPTSSRAVGSLPILIAAPDLPVPKRSKTAGDVIELNHGLHLHGVLIVPVRSRLETSADVHFRDHRQRYARRPVAEVDVRPIVETPERALDYVLKSVRRGRFSFDDVLILPRAISEVRDGRLAAGAYRRFAATQICVRSWSDSRR
jgi:hypothetical protein